MGESHRCERVPAALCAQLDWLPRHLDYRLIQEKLDEMGASLQACVPISLEHKMV
jgi:uncharacterized cysteine cluster protein YcgN (CxxCxxCC family)